MATSPSPHPGAPGARVPFLVFTVWVAVLCHPFGGCGYDPSQNNESSPTPVQLGDDDTPPGVATPTACPDQDEDGFCADIDCNDMDPDIYPGAEEVCDRKDNDCDGVRDVDEDGDGFISEAACPGGTDCDDADVDVHPGAPEVCNYVDDDCDGIPDDGVEPQTYYRDNDGDGYGTGALPKESCTPPPNHSLYGNDCNDMDPDIYPGADEICNGIDDDCDDVIDNGVKLTTYPDMDGDGYGDGTQPPRYSCTVTPGYVEDDADCDDADPNVHPGAVETCNGLDDDCDGEPDDGLVRFTYYQDMDGDGHGVDLAIVLHCDQPEGYAPVDDDCDDTDPAAYPGAEERCNGLDDDCDGEVPLEETEDVDGDGAVACADCDDGAAEVYPGALEVCNGLDDDCDGGVDEETPEGAEDTDGDQIPDCLDDCPRWVDRHAAGDGDGSWTSPYASIQAAIDAFAWDASCADIKVQPGVYEETIDFHGYPLRIRAAFPVPRVDLDTYLAGEVQDPVDVSVIDGQGVGPVVTLSQTGGQDVALVGFVVRGGDTDGCGGGILVTGGTPRIERNRVETCTAAQGGGVCLQGTGAAVLRDNDVLDNTVTGSGGGVFVDAGQVPEITGNAVLGNRGTDGAGVYLDAGDAETAQFVLEDNAVYRNVAVGRGGGMLLKGHVGGSIAGNVVVENEAEYGAGIYVDAADQFVVAVTGGFFDANIAAESGGAILVTGTGGLVLETTSVTGCGAPRGGGVFVDAHAGVLLEDVTLDGNGGETGEQGGGLYVSSLGKATVSGGFVQFNAVTGQGGGIHAGQESSLTVEGTYIGNNTAALGAGIYAAGLSSISVGKGETSETEIAYNEASSLGGGIYLADFQGTELNGMVTACRIHDNQASNGAGMVIDNSLFLMSANQVRNNTAVVGQGGGILCAGDVRMSIPNTNIISGNEPAETEGCP